MTLTIREHVIYNGIRPEKKVHLAASEKMALRRNFAGDDEKIVYYVGRMSL